MKRFLSRFFASPLSVWVAWIGIFGWSWIQIWRNQMRPAWWPIISLVVLLVVSVFVHAVRLILAFARRQQRLSTLRAFLLAMIPVTLLAAHISYIYIAALNRFAKPGPLMRSLGPMSVVVAEIEAHCRYPYKTTGERVVMFHDGIENAREQVAAADAWLAELDEVMGHPSRAMIYWIRGPIFGREGYSFEALSMGSSGGNQIGPRDKHELAHSAIDQHLTTSARMPVVLAEGWAEACATDDAGMLWSNAAREAGWTPSLKELVSRPWSYLDRGPVYTQGGPFVTMLLEEYGGEKFFEFYHTCSAETFDADCRRVFGVGLDELQQQYESRLAEWSEVRQIRKLLESLPVDAAIDLEDWQQFIEDYCRAADFDETFDEFEGASTVTRTGFSDAGTPEKKQNLVKRSFVSTDRVKASIEERKAAVVNGDHSFLLTRRDKSQPWRLYEAWFPEVERWEIRRALAESVPNGSRFAFYPEIWRENPPTVTGFRRSDDSGGEQCVLSLESIPQTEDAQPHDEPFVATMTFSSAVNWRMVSNSRRSLLEEGADRESRYEYGFESDKVREIRTFITYRNAKGKLISKLTAETHFNEISEIDPADYTLAAFGIERETREVFPTIPTLSLVFLILAGGQFIVVLLLRRVSLSTDSPI